MTGTRVAIQDATSATHSLGLSIAIVIPTCNAAHWWRRMHDGLLRQGIESDQVLVIDSSSTDGTQELVQRAGYRLKVVERDSFRHGATRQIAAEFVPEAEILVYLTQDAIPTGDRPIDHLIEAFNDPLVGAAYGRQLPREQADDIERHARLFNYPPESAMRDFESRKELGIKTAFFSNSFAAYRRTAFDEVGGFPKHSIVSEEVTVVARMLMAGWRIAYRADATVIHSHHFTLRKEFSRYFDIGVHHGREAWLLDTFGHAAGEGARFVRSEAEFLRRSSPSLLPRAALRTLNKMLAYQLGQHEAYLPSVLKQFLSAQPSYWRDDREKAELRSFATNHLS